MNPQPTYKKFLLPAVIIIALVIVGLLLFLKGGAVDQGAALFGATTQTSSLRGVPPTSVACRPTVGANGALVAPAPSIKVISPNGGEVFTDGQQITVKWSSCNIPASSVATLALHLYDINNNSLGNIGLTNSTSLNDGSETITLPTLAYIRQANPGFFQNAVFGKHFKIDLGSGVNGAVQDFSDNLFTINGPVARICKPTDPLSIRVESPNGGETFTAGQQILVRWGTCGGRSDDTAQITLTTSFGQGGSAVIATVAEQPGYSMVTLPSSIGSVPVVAGNYYKIKVDYLDNVPGGSLFATDISNGFFRIQ